MGALYGIHTKLKINSFVKPKRKLSIGYMETVKTMDEYELTLNHPHLTTCYHVLAIVYFADYVSSVQSKLSQLELESSPHFALNSVATIFFLEGLGGGKDVFEAAFQEFAAAQG